jgi:hypothetical protein
MEAPIPGREKGGISRWLRPPDWQEKGETECKECGEYEKGRRWTMKKVAQAWPSAFLPIIFLSLVSWTSPTGEELRWTARELEFVRSTVQAHYPYLELKGVGARDREPVSLDQDEGFVRGASDNKRTAAGFRRQVLRLLKDLRDGHVYLEEKGRKTFPYTPPRRKDRGAFDPASLPDHLGAPLRPMGQGDVFFSRTAENIGYILIRSFRHERVGHEVGRALRHLVDTKGLILDVRNNGGGNAAVSNRVIARFLSEPLEKPPVFHSGRQLAFPPLIPTYPVYGSPVVVLVNGVCFSEAERFAEIMRRLPQVILVGDTTGGGSAGGGDRFFLPNGSVLSFGTYDYRRYDGTPWEEEGIAPDLVVPQTTVHAAAGVDAQLEVALGLLG